MLITYDPEVDILMIYLLDPETLLSGAEELPDQVYVHYSKEGRVASVEVLNASSKLPERELLKYKGEGS